MAEGPRRLLDRLVERRRRGGEPLQYITGRQAFRGLELLVGPGVMIPRPETEMVVEQALSRLAGISSPRVVDLCTGSGAIALAVATERPDSVVWATEISDEALAWARRNLERAEADNVTLLQGDLLGPLPEWFEGSVDLVVANPPYLSVVEVQVAPPEVRDHEPREALMAGPTGLELAARVVTEACEWLAPGGWLVMETSPTQAERLRALMHAHYTHVDIHRDLAGMLRIAEGRRPGGPHPH